MTKIIALRDALRKAGLSVAIWRGSRLYINSLRLDVSAFFTFEDPDSEATDNLLEGATFRVFYNIETGTLQPWMIDKTRQCKHNLMHGMFVAGILKIEPPADWRDVPL